MTRKTFQARLYRAGSKPSAGLKLRIPTPIVDTLRLRHGQKVELALHGNVIKVKVTRRRISRPKAGGHVGKTLQPVG